MSGEKRGQDKRFRVVVSVDGSSTPVHVSPLLSKQSAEHVAKNYRAMIDHRGWSHTVVIEEDG